MYLTCVEETPNSSLKEGRVRATPWSQRLSANHPKPAKANNCHWYLPIPMSWIALLITLDFPVSCQLGLGDMCLIDQRTVIGPEQQMQISMIARQLNNLFGADSRIMSTSSQIEFYLCSQTFQRQCRSTSSVFLWRR